MRWLSAWGVLFLIMLGTVCLLGAAEAQSDAAPGAQSAADDTSADQIQTGRDNTRVWTLLAVYCGLIVLASLVGGFVPDWVELTHTRMQTLISGVGGLMLGIAVFHLLPHSLEHTGSPKVTCQWLMGGLLVMFFLVRAFHFHHHGAADPLADHETCHHHDHDHDEGHHHHPPSIHHLNWVGVAAGLAIHTLIDGIALGASVKAEANGSMVLSLFGLGTFLAVLLHKPLDAISITSLMAAGGWSRAARNAVNLGFALMCPVGALLFLLGLGQISSQAPYLLGCALAFAAGVFLCISLGDLLPELELHSHHRIRLSVALLCGVALAWMIEQTH
jgi:zinc and cadmium transporter